MTYSRVLPRDLFNEGNLLKCLGQLMIDLGRNPSSHGAVLEDNGSEDGFEIEQDPADGSIHVTTMLFTVRGVPHRLYRPLNSRQAYPLYVEDNEGGSIEVFTEMVTLSREFLRLIYVDQEPLI